MRMILMRTEPTAYEIPGIWGGAAKLAPQPTLTVADWRDVELGAIPGQVALPREPFEAEGFQSTLPWDEPTLLAA
jgi:hypothetical protein